MIHGGTRFNIIPGEVLLEGTVRTYDSEVQDTIERWMREILDGVTRAGGGTFELDYDRITPVTINDLTLTQRSVPSLINALGEDQVSMADPWMAGDGGPLVGRAGAQRPRAAAAHREPVEIASVFIYLEHLMHFF